MPRPFHFLTHDDHPAVARTVARLRASLLAVVVTAGVLLLLTLLAIRQAASEPHDGASFAGIPLDSTLVALIAGFFAMGVLLVLIARSPFALARDQAIGLIEINRQLAESTLETFAALNAAIEAKDRYGSGHGLRVTLVSILIAQELGIPEQGLDVLRQAATFHDIGKIAVPDAVLQKTGRLTDTEFEAMKVHPIESARICSKLHALRPAVPLVRAHHERVDGRGYPDGLVGDDIPVGARILAVADAWDALTSDRPYRQGQPAFVALEEIRRCTGSQFDERVVAAFVEVLAKDPWMFGLTPEDVAANARSLPAPTPTSRGVGGIDDGRGGSVREDGDLVSEREREIDWSAGFADDDLRAG